MGWQLRKVPRPLLIAELEHAFTHHPRLRCESQPPERTEVMWRMPLHALLGRRLGAAGVSFEDRQHRLGHRSGGITTHYSVAELSCLLEDANTACDANVVQPELLVMRDALLGESGKTPATAKVVLRAGA